MDCPNVPSSTFILHVHRQANCFLNLFLGNSLSEPCLTHYDICNHLWLLLMRKFTILRSPKHHFLRLYCAWPLWRLVFNRDNQMYISSQVKSALRKCREDKDHDCDLFVSDVGYLCCTSVLFHVWLNGPLYLLNLNALTKFLLLQTIAWENDESCE